MHIKPQKVIFILCASRIQPKQCQRQGRERSFHLFIMTFFWVVFLWHPRTAVGVQLTGSFRLKVQRARGANSGQFACMKSPGFFLNRVDGPASIQYSCIQLSLPLTWPSIPTRDSSYFSCSGPFLYVKVASRRTPVRRLYSVLLWSLSQYVFLISKCPWRSTNRPQR